MRWPFGPYGPLRVLRPLAVRVRALVAVVRLAVLVFSIARRAEALPLSRISPRPARRLHQAPALEEAVAKNGRAAVWASAHPLGAERKPTLVAIPPNEARAMASERA